MQIDPKIEKDLIEKLIDKEYNQSLINQIIKAYEKGYDLSIISKDVNINKLRKVIKELPELEKLDNKSILDIFIKMYGGTKSAKRRIALKPNTQSIILKGLEAGINPDAYAYTDILRFDPRVITEIGIVALKINKDINEYFEKGYDTSQTNIMLVAIGKGFDIEKYITPTKDFKEIGGVYKLMEFYHTHKIKEDELFKNLLNLKLKRKVMEKVIECLEEGVDISIIFSEKVEKHQIPILLTASKKSYDISPLLDSRLNTDQMNIIMTGLDFGVDVYQYNSPAYTADQMTLIFKALKYNKEHDNKIDLNPILNPKLPFNIMFDYIKAIKSENKSLYEESIKNLNKYNNQSKER